MRHHFIARPVPHRPPPPSCACQTPLLLTPPIAIFTLCTCKRNCTNGIISCFLFHSLLRERCVAFRFVLFVVLICFRFGFLQIFLSFSPRAPRRIASAVQIQLEQESTLLLAARFPLPCSLLLALPCRLTALAAFHLALRRSSLLSCAAFALSYSEIKAKKGTRRSRSRRNRCRCRCRRCRHRRSRKTSKNFFVFLWGVSNNF